MMYKKTGRCFFCTKAENKRILSFLLSEGSVPPISTCWELSTWKIRYFEVLNQSLTD